MQKARGMLAIKTDSQQDNKNAQIMLFKQTGSLEGLIRREASTPKLLLEDTIKIVDYGRRK